MSLHRFYLPPERWEESSPELDPADAHHATDVLRLGVGDTITLFDGQGRVKKEKGKRGKKGRKKGRSFIWTYSMATEELSPS